MALGSGTELCLRRNHSHGRSKCAYLFSETSARSEIGGKQPSAAETEGEPGPRDHLQAQNRRNGKDESWNRDHAATDDDVAKYEVTTVTRQQPTNITNPTLIPFSWSVVDLGKNDLNLRAQPGSHTRGERREQAKKIMGPFGEKKRHNRRRGTLGGCSS